MQPRLRFIIPAAIALATFRVVKADDVKQEIATATRACEQDASAGNKTARYTCAEKLAQIADKLVSAFREYGSRNNEALVAIWTELKKYPMPADSDSKKLTKLLIGRWDSPRRTYVFKANGKCGAEDGPKIGVGKSRETN